MRTTRVLSLSFPPELLKAAERVAKIEGRTKSELFREALRSYMYQRYPVASASKEELAAIARGRAQIRKGEYVTLEQLVDGLATTNRKTRRKVTR